MGMNECRIQTARRYHRFLRCIKAHRHFFADRACLLLFCNKLQYIFANPPFGIGRAPRDLLPGATCASYVDSSGVSLCNVPASALDAAATCAGSTCEESECCGEKWMLAMLGATGDKPNTRGE